MKKGISLVALVITIIVLIILTGAVVLMGINVPENAQLAVFKSNVGTVQDVVTMKMVSNTIQYANIGETNKYKWVGVVSGYTIENAEGGIDPIFAIDDKIPDVLVAQVDSSIGNNLIESDISKYYVDVNGVIYHEGQEFNGIIYYNATKTTTGTPSGGGTAGGGSDIPTQWVQTSLNNNTPYVTEEIKGIMYYAPIPKGFVASEATGENTISGGLVIYEGSTEVTNENVDLSKTTRNQFVWVPVNNSYNINTDYVDITYNQGIYEAALEYWTAREEGVTVEIEYNEYNEPYPRTEGSVEKEEWDSMYESVMKYGGFYIGRYEMGKVTNTEGDIAVVKQGQTVWNDISWNDAVPLSRALYTDTTKYGVTSTLIYGIQWDSMMHWANCASEAGRHVLEATGSVENDKYNNVYDLRSNCCEWSMEAKGTSYRANRGGDYYIAYAVSYRYYDYASYSFSYMSFRSALYVN